MAGSRVAFAATTFERRSSGRCRTASSCRPRNSPADQADSRPVKLSPFYFVLTGNIVDVSLIFSFRSIIRKFDVPKVEYFMHKLVDIKSRVQS